MSEFEELLTQVLREDGNSLPPAGMEQRIVAGLSTEKDLIAGRRRIWAGVAAGLLVGLTSWTVARLWLATPAATPQEHVSLWRPGGLPVSMEHREQKPRDRGETSHFRIAIHPHAGVRRRGISIAPVQIEPLVIEPIQIASLALAGSARKGVTR
jgi:hypothetical protein